MGKVIAAGGSGVTISSQSGHRMPQLGKEIDEQLCTHEGSGLGRSEKDFKKLCPKAKVANGLAVRGGNVDNADKKIKNWLKSI